MRIDHCTLSQILGQVPDRQMSLAKSCISSPAYQVLRQVSVVRHSSRILLTILRLRSCVVKGNLHAVRPSVSPTQRRLAADQPNGYSSVDGEKSRPVALMSKRASLLGKFPIDEPGRSKSKRRIADRVRAGTRNLEREGIRHQLPIRPGVAWAQGRAVPNLQGAG
jgi:hypothetical protein